MIIETAIQTLKTKLLDLQWTPTGNSSATSFVGGVYTAPKITAPKDSPWCFINDEAPTITKIGTRGANGNTVYQKDTVLGITICSNYASLDDLEESLGRLRYAIEAVEDLIKQGSVANAISPQGWNYRGWEAVDIASSKILARKLNLIVTETI